MTDSLEYLRNQLALSRTEIKNLRQQITGLKHEYQKEMLRVNENLNSLRCANCSNTATTISTNNIDHQESGGSSNNIKYCPIGHIETSFQSKRGVPRQPNILAKVQGTVVIDSGVFNNPDHALSGLDEFSHMWIIYHFHTIGSASTPAKVSPPRLDGERRGVFSTRSPHRPSPIGLSLVKILAIDGNKVHFLGVDMVNGTPVLDIKPYIPQYDYPTSIFGEAMPSMTRPPTEGTSEVPDVANLQLDSGGFDDTRMNTRLTYPVGVETNSPLSHEDSSPVNNVTPTSPSPNSPSSIGLLDTNARSPMRRSDTERGAPDGQERFTPPQSHLLSIAQDGIRVAPWILDPPSQRFEVNFTEDALRRLNELIGDRAQAFKGNIESLLSEDPRSHYVRNRYPEHEYNCVLEDLSITCVFDSSSSICTIVMVRSAEELQQT